MKISLKQKIAAVAAAATIVGGSGVALAFWTTTGSGTGSAATTAGVVNKLSFVTSTIAPMFPGDLAQPFTVKVTNTDLNESAYVASVKAYLTVVGSGTCDATDFKLNGAVAPGTAAAAVALGWTAEDLSVAEFAVTNNTDTIQFNNKATAQDGCKTAAVTLNYLAS